MHVEVNVYKSHFSRRVQFCYILAPYNVTTFVCLKRHLPGAVVVCFQYSLHYDVTEYTYITSSLQMIYLNKDR